MGGSVAVVGGTPPGGTPPGGTPPGGTPPGGTPPGGTPTTYVAPPSSLTEAQLSTAQKTAIQQRLNELGYRGANGLALVADGNIGANTRAAISDFQRNNALSPVDGVAGRNTREKLALSTAVRATGTPPGGTPPGGTPPGGTPPGGTPTTYVAPPSSLTEAQLSTAQKTAIQQRLNELGYRGANGLALVADGNIGANTRAAISDFQRNNALSPVDGVAGRNTREKLALSTAVRATGTPPGGTPPGGTGTDALAGYRAAASELQTWIRSQPMSAIYDSNRRSVFNATLEGYQRRMNMGAASDGKYGPGTRSRMRELGVATPYEFPATPGATPVVEPPPQPMPPVAPVTANAASVSTQGVPWWAWGIGLAIVGGAVMYAGMAGGGGGGGGGGSREQYAALPRAEDRRIVVRPLRKNPRKSNKRRRR